jgi:hypothetical protein
VCVHVCVCVCNRQVVDSGSTRTRVLGEEIETRRTQKRKESDTLDLTWKQWFALPRRATEAYIHDSKLVPTSTWISDSKGQ